MFERHLDEKAILRLQNDLLFIERLKPDVQKGEVFPAIRVNRLDFYHKGRELFSYDAKGKFSTHKKYAAVVRSESSYVSESDLQRNIGLLSFSDPDVYHQIKENCSLHSGDEAEGVSRIYHKYPFTKNSPPVVVLDIEISFKGEGKKAQDRVDILLLDKRNGQLRFYEAKHFSNSSLWGSQRNKMFKQIRDYESQIQKQQANIIGQYGNYVRIVKQLFDCNLPNPRTVDNTVPLLVFGFDKDQEKGRLKELVLGTKCHYFIGNISRLNIVNMWNKTTCG